MKFHIKYKYKQNLQNFLRLLGIHISIKRTLSDKHKKMLRDGGRGLREVK